MNSGKTDFAISFEERPALRALGVKVGTDMEHAGQDCPALWKDFEPRMREVRWSRPESYGISVVTGETKSGFTFDYWAVIPTAEDTPLPEGMEEFRLAGGMFALFAVPSLAEASAAYDWFYSQWLPGQSEYALKMPAFCFELYAEEYLETGKFYLYFPVVKK
jgi:Uncharacterized protein conserved in bacteria